MTMRRVSPWAPFLGALALHVMAGCDRMPDAAAATRAFGEHRTEIDAADGAVRLALREIPPAVTCADPASVGTDPEAAQAFVRCQEAQGAQREAERAVWTTLRRDGLPDLLDAHTSVLGVEVVSGSITSEAGTVFPSNVGAAAGEGTSIEGHDLGWNLYQTAFEVTPPGESAPRRAGDGEARPGIEVRFDVTEGDRTAQVRVVILLDAQTDAAWRALHRRASGG